MSVAALDRSPPLEPLGARSSSGGRADGFLAGWRAPTLAALIVLVSALPGLLALPALDRDESRVAQASAQMLESGDFVNIRFQAEPRDKKPVGLHWLQAASVRLLSSAEARNIQPYRLPSLLGAMLAAAACSWGAGAAFGARGGMIAGGVLGASLLLSSEAFVGKTDAVLCGAVTLAMAGLGRLYLSARGGAAVVGRAEPCALWLGLALGVLDKGPVAPMVAVVALAALAITDRDVRWMKGLGWGRGMLLLLSVVGPWAFAITVTTDGGFWTGLQGDIALKLRGVHQRHAGPPGLHALLAPLLMFPSGLLLPAALAAGWARRAEPAVRFALAWLAPAWLVFEAAPTKLIHDPLPLYGALAWLIASAATGQPIGAKVRIAGMTLGGAAALCIAGVALALSLRFGGGSGLTIGVAIVVAALALGSATAGGWLLWRERPAAALAAAGVLGAMAHIVLTGFLAPRFGPLWISARAAALVDQAGLDPRDGRTVGPVAVAGYAEPSLVFALGTDTDLDSSGAEAAEALAVGSPALIERREEASFRATLGKRGAVARSVGVVRGFDYSNAREVQLTLWRPIRLAPLPPGAEAATDAATPKDSIP